MSENKAMGSFPIAVFIDTNILDSLPEDLQSGDLSSLAETAEKTGARVYIPDVVAREWLKHRLDKIVGSFREYRKSRDHLKNYLPTIPEWKVTEDDYLNSVYRALIGRLRRSGCRVLGPPKTTIRGLTHRAVWEEPPFRGANKGFKDELVVVAMLKLVSRGWNYRTYVLVTKDHDFPGDSLEERFRRRNVVFEKVQSLHEAKELLAKRFSEKGFEAWKQDRAKTEDEIRAFLSQHWDSISQAVTRKFAEEGISTWTIYGYGQKDIPEHAYIKRVVKISPSKIGTIDVGKEDEKTRETPVTIGVEAVLTLEVEYGSLFAVFSETIGPEGRRSPPTPVGTQTREHDIVREIQCYAVVKRGPAGPLSELHLVDMRPDYKTLQESLREKGTPSS